MLAPTQAVAALISKWEWRFTEVFFRAIRDSQHLLIHNLGNSNMLFERSNVADFTNW